MSLTRKILNCTSAGLLALGILTYNPKDARISSALAQAQTLSCEQIVEKHKKKLEGRFWGLGRGCLDRFEPERRDNSSYQRDFTCIKDFLEEYDEGQCGKNQLYNESIDALLKNIFVEDNTIRTWTRILLHQEGVLDHQKQLKEILFAAMGVREKIKSAGESYSDLNLAQRKEMKVRVESWKNYLEDLRVQAVMVTDQALFLREQPKTPSLENISEEIAEGINLSYRTLGNLVALEGYLTQEDWYGTYHSFKEWKKDQKKVYGKLTSILEQGMDFGLFELGRWTKWVKIGYRDTEGEWQYVWATKEFAQEWGDHGKNYYQEIERIDEIIAEVEKVSLRKVVVKERETKKGKAEARVEKETKKGKAEARVSNLSSHHDSDEGQRETHRGTPAAEQPREECLVSFWNFNEGEDYGNTAFDANSSGSLHTHGTIYGATRVPGVRGKALYFDGIDDKVSVDDNRRLDLSTEMTLMSWIRRDGHSGGRIICKRDDVSGKGYGYEIKGSSGKLWVHLDMRDSFSSTGTIPINQWTHIATTYNSNLGIARLYINGNLDSEHYTRASLRASRLALQIGRQGNGGNYFHGWIDEVKVYSCALTPGQITYEYRKR